MATIDSLTKSFSSGFTLDVENLVLSQKMNIYGSNGSGKTTFLRLVAGIMEPDKFIAKGEKESKLDKHQKSLYFSDQDIGLFPHLSGLENIKYFCPSIDEANLKKWQEVLPFFARALKTKASSLSIGMAKIIKLYIFLSHEADCYLLDEPFSHFDGEAEKFISDLILENSSHFIITSHQEYPGFENIKVNEKYVFSKFN